MVLHRLFGTTEGVKVEGMDEARTQMQEVKRILLITTINKTNYPIGEKQTDWTGHKAGLDTRQDWTQGRTGHKAGLDTRQDWTQGRTGHKAGLDTRHRRPNIW